jgi:cytochrome c oxidase subunit 4
MKTDHPSVKSLVLIWLALVALHFLILGISMEFRGIGAPVILPLAVLQMILVMLVFMEVRRASKLVRVFTVAGFFWLAIQFVLTASDYLTRGFH